MKLQITRQRMLLGGLLLAAGLGLLCDQYLFAASPASENEYAMPAASSSSMVAAPKVAKSAPLTPERLLAERLAKFSARRGAVRDVFNTGSPAVAGDASNAFGANPLSKRSLNGVLFGADGKGVAIIDGRMVKIGMRVDGLRLVRVSTQAAVFSDGTREYSLKISQKSTAGN